MPEIEKDPFLSADKDFVKDKILNDINNVPCNIFSYIRELMMEHELLKTELQLLQEKYDVLEVRILKSESKILELEKK